MTKDETLEILKKVHDIATLAGVRGSVNEDRDHFEAGFDLEGGRTQRVFVRVVGEGMGGTTVVNIFSPCHTVKKGFLKGLGKTEALDLLRTNENLFYARYGIWSGDDEEMIVASVDRTLETLDHADFHQLVWYVAIAADRVEKEHGVDRF